MFGQRARIKQLEAIIAEHEDSSEATYNQTNNLKTKNNELERRIKTLVMLRDDTELAKYSLQVADKIADIYAQGRPNVNARRIDVAIEVQRAMRSAVSGTEDWWDNYGRKPGEYPEPKPTPEQSKEP